jgi:hypothetical protein
MKKLIIALIAIAGIFTVDTAQAEGNRYVMIQTDGTSGNSQSITVKSGEVAILAYLTGWSNDTQTLSVQYGSVQHVWHRSYWISGAQSGTSDTKDGLGVLTVVGPSTITLGSSGEAAKSFAIFKISPNLAE